MKTHSPQEARKGKKGSTPPNFTPFDERPHFDLKPGPCAAPDCSRSVVGYHVVCGPHLRELPAPLRRRVLALRSASSSSYPLIRASLVFSVEDHFDPGRAARLAAMEAELDAELDAAGDEFRQLLAAG